MSKACDYPVPSRQIEFARLNLTNTLTSKRKCLKLVKDGIVDGWDDPRMSTICGMRRKGYPAEALIDFIKVKEIVKDANGEITELICTYDPASKGGNSPDGRKVKGTIQWVDANNCLNATVNMYDKLFVTSNPGDLEDYLENLNPESLVVLKDCKIDADLASAKPGDSFQFMRNGYFTVDKYSKEDDVVFNLTATLKDSFKIQ